MIPGSNTVDVLGFPMTSFNRETILKTVDSWIVERLSSHHLMALNPIKVCRARREPELAGHILEAELVYPDGVGVSWAMSLFTGTPFQPIPGCDLMFDLMIMASTGGYRVYLFGASESVVSETKRRFEEQYPGAKIVGIRNGFFKDQEERRRATNDLLAAKPDIVFVAMGARIQEDWIAHLKKSADETGVVIPLLMGVGGSFDAATGRLPRPQKWMLQWHLEWLSRLLRQPTRAPRMMSLPHFVLLILGKRYLGMDLDYRPNGSTLDHRS